MQKGGKEKPLRKAQEQELPGTESKMNPKPDSDPEIRNLTQRLKNKVALITGGDSGIGKAVALLYAREGAKISIVYLDEHKDANETKKEIESLGSQCLLIPGDIGNEAFCFKAVQKTVDHFGKLDILINNAATQMPAKTLEDISTEQLLRTYHTNIFSMFWITKAALKHLKKGSAVINTTSVTAYRGSKELIDYASTKGAIVSFTRSLASNLIEKGIRVNAVAPGPVWTPLIPASFDAEKVASFGSDSPMKRAGEPSEIAPSYLFLATEDSSFMTGQVLHPNGGEVVNG